LLKLRDYVLDLLAIGGITFDNLFWVNRLPEKHFEAVVRRYGRYFGGRAANVAVAAAKLGIKTGVVSPVGADFTSSGYKDYLVRLGIDLRGVVEVPKRKTKQIFIFTDLAGNQVTFFYYGAESHFKKIKVPVDLIKESKIVHITSSGDYKFNVRCAKTAYENNMLVSFDPANDPFTEIPEYLSEVIRCTTFLFMNDVESSGILTRLGLNRLDQLLDVGPRIVVVIAKNDKSGVIYTKEAFIQLPSAINAIKDPTGASDGYIGAFLAAYVKGYDLKTAGMMGAVEASFVVESFGSQTNLPRWQQLYKRYQQYV